MENDKHNELINNLHFISRSAYGDQFQRLHLETKNKLDSSQQLLDLSREIIADQAEMITLLTKILNNADLSRKI